MSEKRRGGLVVSDRPQISVEMDEHGMVHILATRIADNFKDVEHEEVMIPADCVEEVAQAMLALVKQ